MEVTNVTERDEGRHLWITLKGEETIIIHVLADSPMKWSKSKGTLNIIPKR
jgi:hypothetical protein